MNVYRVALFIDARATYKLLRFLDMTIAAIKPDYLHRKAVLLNYVIEVPKQESVDCFLVVLDYVLAIDVCQTKSRYPFRSSLRLLHKFKSKNCDYVDLRNQAAM